MESERSLATVLFVDMVGSTRRAAELGDRRWQALLQKFHARVRQQLLAWGGREKTNAGDGFLALFADPERAILCAWSLRESLRELDVQIRAGVHLGAVERLGGDVGGIAVHVGSRVAALARAAEVLVTTAVYEAVGGSGIEFDDRGSHDLRDVPGKWRLYRVTGIPADTRSRAAEWQAQAQVARWRWRAGFLAVAILAVGVAATLLIRSGDGPKEPARPVVGGPDGAAPAVAVLPFTVRDPRLAEWREGMVDVLSHGLDVSEAGLRTIDSRTVLARWREVVNDGVASDATGLEVARLTGARYAVIGSIVSTGSALDLTSDIYDVAARQELGQVEVRSAGGGDRLPDLTDSLAIRILRTIKGDELHHPRAMTGSLEALKAYLEGERLFRRSDFGGAITAFQRSVEADSTFALALSRLIMATGWNEEIGSVDPALVRRLAAYRDSLPERDQLLLVGGLRLQRGEVDAIDALLRATHRYPDDVEAWSLLGDAYYHLGGRALADEGSVARAFERALTLDASFTPPYIHLIEDAFHRADSARVIRLVPVYGRLAPGNRFDRRHRLAAALAFGDGASRRAALAALDTADNDALEDLAPNLRHVRFLDVQAAVLREIASRPDNPEGERLDIYAFTNEARRGRVTAAARILERRNVPAWFRSEGALLLTTLGLSAARPAGVGPAGGSQGEGVEPATGAVHRFYLGAQALERADTVGTTAAITELRLSGEGALAAGDSTAARFLHAAAAGLDGYARWTWSRDSAASSILDAARRDGTGVDLGTSEVNATIRWWLGEIAEESGRLEDARRYWSSLDLEGFSAWQHPLVTVRLGRVYERLGEEERARAAYDTVVQAWRDAEPSVRSLIDVARAAGRRLTLVRPP